MDSGVTSGFLTIPRSRPIQSGVLRARQRLGALATLVMNPSVDHSQYCCLATSRDGDSSPIVDKNINMD